MISRFLLGQVVIQVDTQCLGQLGPVLRIVSQERPQVIIDKMREHGLLGT